MSKRPNDTGLQSNVGRQEHPVDPGSRRHEPLCRVVEFGMNSVDGQKPEESGTREICQVPGCWLVSGNWWPGWRSVLGEPGRLKHWTLPKPGTDRMLKRLTEAGHAKARTKQHQASHGHTVLWACAAGATNDSYGRNHNLHWVGRGRGGGGEAMAKRWVGSQSIFVAGPGEKSRGKGPAPQCWRLLAGRKHDLTSCS